MYCENVYDRSCKNLFWSFKNSGEVLNKPIAIDFSTISLSTYDFSTLYTTFPHSLIKDELNDLIKVETLLTLHITTETRFPLQNR